MMMTEDIFISHSESDTRNFGYSYGKRIKPGQVVLLYGDLGTGKTVFVKGVGDYLGISGVKSPSFTLINEYKSDKIYLIHSDLYRLEDFNQVEALGLDDYVNSDDCVLFVEWPERWKFPPQHNTVKIFFTAVNEFEREIKIQEAQ
ncbi:MAG: tRNA (adenosine(37)-N6)-threonylcarbamoyltransferase complex ATPase subunit type 1 TsaE [Synergistaceae bacterium]|nr:tRNA (adenosine(37)-N6)-threonylcarbamoyltransferase complex ATPase subunit type 1 TsaE [Synergistaceae bacterium]